MNAEKLEIPTFLRRTKEQPMTKPAHLEAVETKKPRTKVILPTHVSDGEISSFSLTELAALQTDWKEKLANVPLLELQLRAINQEIRKRAK